MIGLVWRHPRGPGRGRRRTTQLSSSGGNVKYFLHLVCCLSIIYIIYLSKLLNYNFSPDIEYEYYYYDDYEKGDHEEYYHHYEDAVHEDSDSSDIGYDYYYNTYYAQQRQ